MNIDIHKVGSINVRVKNYEDRQVITLTIASSDTNNVEVVLYSNDDDGIFLTFGEQ